MDTKRTNDTKGTKRKRLSTCAIFVVFVYFASVVSFVGQAIGREQAPQPKRIISLVPALTEILFAIGAGPQVIAVSSFDEDPPEVLKLPRVGALLDPDTEKILSMRPDLVLTYGSQESLQKQLETAGIPLFSYRHRGLADIAPTFRALGTLTGHVAEAAREVARLERDFDAIRSRIAGRPRPGVLLVIGHDPQSLTKMDASGAVGFLNDMIELAGGRNVLADMERQAVRVSTEMLIVRKPDVILDLHYSRTIGENERRQEMQAWSGLSLLPAVKNHRVHLMLGDRLVVPGPRIGPAAAEYARAIHPEAYK
jgi:iron complex transport system substrate-binding protein